MLHFRRIAAFAGLAFLSFGLPSSSLADEGMWMPEQIPLLEPQLRKLGFTGDPRSFADLTGFPMGAVVSLGGCSASFISPDGLIATNHHCVRSYLQFNATPERPLTETGFLARTRADELPCGPGSRVFVTVAVRDVTAAIMGDLPASLSDLDRQKRIEDRRKQLTAEGERSGEFRRTVASFFQGLKWYAIDQIEIRDVRLVYAPDAGIGNFGGETDNWRWPRHTGDFSFLRAYVSPAGKGAAYSKDNVPFRPKHWLRISPEGIRPGELVFVAGYPGRTSRLATHAAVTQMVDWTLPRTVRRNTEQIALLEEVAKTSPHTALRVGTRIQGLHNVLTKTKGVLEGLTAGGLLGLKGSQEKELLAWIAADPARKSRYGEAIPSIASLIAEGAATRERNALLAELTSGARAANTAAGLAHLLHRLAVERAKPDAGRDPEYQERNWPRLRETVERAQRSLDPAADRALLRYTLRDVARLPAGQRIDALDTAVGLRPGMAGPEADAAIEAWLSRTIAGTRLYDLQFRLSLTQASTKDLAATGDAHLLLAAALFPLEESIRQKGKRNEGALYRWEPLYVEALSAWRGGLVSPDANSTLRVTYGTVASVTDKAGVDQGAQTTLTQLAAKITGAGDFRAPAALLQAIDARRGGRATPYLDPRLKDVPVDYLSTVDITGGNSGSATLNQRGELVGLAFDGTYESVSAEYLFTQEARRSIHVDSRYLLWVLTEVEKADALLAEIGHSRR